MDCDLVYNLWVMRQFTWILPIIMAGCAVQWGAPPEFIRAPIVANEYQIMTYQKISDTMSPIHIYIEGDGYAFDARGRPTNNPTPHGTMLRDMAVADNAPNVIYMARPCQYIMSDSCSTTDWTDGRFSQKIIDAMANGIQSVARGRDVVLIGYSGGAMISGIIINQNPDISVKKWITIAGVLNHADWTDYFGDKPLEASANMNVLPHVSQLHYVAQHDKVVPYELSQRWTSGKNMVIVPDAKHDDFNGLKIDF